jgi:branched-chain amino acid transport system permease protein
VSEPLKAPLAVPVVAGPARQAAGRTTATRRRLPVRIRPLLWALGTLVALAAPLTVERFWLREAMFAFAYIVAALGLTLLLGHAGQLSLGHAFFVAVGAYGYTVLAGPAGSGGSRRLAALALPPVLAAVVAVALAGLAGLLFTPIAARLRGIYLGVATVGLVYGGQHLLTTAESVSGGSNGRSVPSFAIGSLRFDTDYDHPRYLLGVPLGKEELLWYLGLAVTVAALWCCRNMIRSRPGRALRAIQHRELAAGILGVPVTRYKGYAFLISSMYAGLGGVLLALAYGRIEPTTFGFDLAVAFLVMVVIGGTGSPGGAIVGAVLVGCLKDVLNHYVDALPGLAEAGSTGGISPGQAAAFGYGAAVIAVLLFEPGGAAAIGRRLYRLVHRAAPQ